MNLADLITKGINSGLIQPEQPSGQPDNYYYEGYRWGVMFSDGSLLSCWNGKTQMSHAYNTYNEHHRTYPDERLFLVRQARGSTKWEIITSANN